ncbi:MAG TPA: alanine racemase [Chloroflexota bacterium]|nr:alanine racemase [Chloroflexota bacterium]
MSLGVYAVTDLSTVPSPAMLVFRQYLEHNLDQTIAIAGGAEFLRPHCKTHKTREVIRMWLERGVRRHKCATLREAEMCIEAGAHDVLIAYQMVGPNVGQFVQLAAAHPDVQLASLVDDLPAATALSQAATACGITVRVLVDLDTGLHRTGVGLDRAQALYAASAALPGLRLGGLHIYDAQHNSLAVPEQREAAVSASIGQINALVNDLASLGYAIPEVVGGGSATFPYYTHQGAPFTGSPGTTVFWDHGYAQRYPDLDPHFVPAALLLGRVISRPAPQHLTLDIGTKAIAADPPIGKRGRILGLEDAETLLHNEEHWALRTDRAGTYSVGDTVFVVPTHVCPSTNLHPVLHIVEADGSISARWEVAARQRTLTEI